MALSFSVFNRFRAIDGVTAPVRKMAKSVGKFGKVAVRAFTKADRKASKFNKTLKAILIGGGILAGAMLLRQGIGDVTNQFVKFDDAIFAAGARFKDIGPDVDNFTASIKGIEGAARAAGAATEFTATQSAEALDFLARAGFTSAEAIGSLNSMINLATASGEDFSRVADISSDLLGAFGLNADNTAQKIKNLNRLNDVLVKTVNSANVTVEDMFETMKQVGPVATGILGASLEEVAALTAVLGSSGIKGSQAMTALKNAYIRLAAPTSEARKLMDALGVTIDDGTGGARKMTDVMEDVGKAISGLSKVKQAEVLDIMFGKRAIAGAKNITDNIVNIRKFEKALMSAAGTSQRTADIMRQSLGNRIKALNSAMVEFGFKILESFKIDGVDAISALTAAVREFNVDPIINGLTFVKDIAVTTFNVFRGLGPEIILLMKLFVGWKIAMFAFNAVMAVTNAIMLANPFVLFLVAAVAVIAAIREIVKNWKFLVNEYEMAAEKFEKGVKSVASAPVKAAGTLGSLLGFGPKLAGAFDPEKGVHQESPAPVPVGVNREESRSRVDVNFSNLPKGTEVEQSGSASGFNLDLGFSGA